MQELKWDHALHHMIPQALTSSDPSLEILACDRNLNHAWTNIYRKTTKIFATGHFGQGLMKTRR